MFGFFGGLTLMNVDLVALPQTKIVCGSHYLYARDVRCIPYCAGKPQEQQPLIAVEQETKCPPHASSKDCKIRRPYRPNLRPSLETIDEEKCLLRTSFLKRNRFVLSHFKRTCKLRLTKLRHKIHARPSLSSCY
ncbi:hypothetical protein O6H91_02G110500 [Diphasiastrum complanatum]|uniref:Uncharacterized protein n=1 Tax=Diphasiastrum complanatum TaxID=34168 RepID=A0ACC2EJD0_DIPCM|nr:hypothetical protein O6H91_02G110500 [Diphasiastrum complanatum]